MNEAKDGFLATRDEDRFLGQRDDKVNMDDPSKRCKSPFPTTQPVEVLLVLAKNSGLAHSPIFVNETRIGTMRLHASTQLLI